MDLLGRLQDLAGKIRKQRELIQTEEAAKTAFVMPFLSALGCDVFNPSEVVPEFIMADVEISAPQGKMFIKGSHRGGTIQGYENG